MARENRQKREAKRFGKPERLADMVSEFPWRLPDYCAGIADDPESLRSLLNAKREILTSLGRTKVVLADNVCEFLYAENPKEEWHWGSDFPACMPPFGETFLEFGRPSRILSEGKVVSSDLMPDRWGWLFYCEPARDVLARAETPEYRESLLKGVVYQLNHLRPLIDMTKIEAVLSGGGLTVEAIQGLPGREQTYLHLLFQCKMLSSDDALPASVFPDGARLIRSQLLMAARGVICFLAEANFVVNPAGQIIEHPVFRLLGGNRVSAEFADQLRDSFNSMLFPALLTVSFMNCKNVTVSPVDPPADRNRVRREAGRKPFLRYHIINIEPMKAVLRTEGGVDSHGLRRALHICRGHFATYSEEKPLFGRIAGTVWRPAHVRGSAKQGVVFSDYQVNAPEGAQ